MSYRPVTYVSKILWRFFGGSSPDNWHKGLEDIQHIFKNGKISLEPYHGLTGYRSSYTRQVVYEEDKPNMNSMYTQLEGGMTEEGSIIYAKEPKAVCFCDIPLNHLALHMKKYNCVGIGIDRDLLASKSKDLQPVRYHFVRDKKEFYESKHGLYKSKREQGGSTTVLFEDYVKIPTLFKGDSSVNYTSDSLEDHLDASEGFNSIYEEREWRLFDSVEIGYEDVAFLLLPKRGIPDENLGKLVQLFEKRVGVIYADQLFHKEEHEKK